MSRRRSRVALIAFAIGLTTSLVFARRDREVERARDLAAERAAVAAERDAARNAALEMARAEQEAMRREALAEARSSLEEAAAAARSAAETQPDARESAREARRARRAAGSAAWRDEWGLPWFVIVLLGGGVLVGGAFWRAAQRRHERALAQVAYVGGTDPSDPSALGPGAAGAPPFEARARSAADRIPR